MDTVRWARERSLSAGYALRLKLAWIMLALFCISISCKQNLQSFQSQVTTERNLMLVQSEGAIYNYDDNLYWITNYDLMT